MLLLPEKALVAAADVGSWKFQQEGASGQRKHLRINLARGVKTLVAGCLREGLPRREPLESMTQAEAQAVLNESLARRRHAEAFEEHKKQGSDHIDIDNSP